MKSLHIAFGNRKSYFLVNREFTSTGDGLPQEPQSDLPITPNYIANPPFPYVDPNVNSESKGSSERYSPSKVTSTNHTSIAASSHSQNGEYIGIHTNVDGK